MDKELGARKFTVEILQQAAVREWREGDQEV